MAGNPTGGLSLRRPTRPPPEHEMTSLTLGRYSEAEWEAKEALRQRELEESRARAQQMEKTMRWWSDCTANWREKWSKVRNERNKAREEARQLRHKFDAAQTQAQDLTKEKVELAAQNEELKKELEKMHLLLLRHASEWDHNLEDVNIPSSTGPLSLDQLKASIEAEVSSVGSEAAGVGEESECEEPVSILPKVISPARSPKEESDTYEEDTLVQKMSMLELRLTEATKTIQAERDEKTTLHRTMEKLTTEVQELRDKCQALKLAKQDAVRDLLALQDEHRNTVVQIQAELQDETNTRENVDRRMQDLRAELERLQAENAAEWGKRERLETEKLSLERDNKKLKGEMRDLQERLERRGQPQHSTDAELRTMQQELSERNKELSDLKHSNTKLKKILSDKVTELAHAGRRAEQYETEVKRLRARVEELKRDLAVAEDELDSATNNIRKLQRTNDELQEQVDNQEVQLGHLHTRLRSNSSSALRTAGSAYSDDEGQEY